MTETRPQSDAGPAVHAVCRNTLEQYLDDPWRWPREHDLVVDLVVSIRAALRKRGESDRTLAEPCVQQR